MKTIEYSNRTVSNKQAARAAVVLAKCKSAYVTDSGAVLIRCPRRNSVNGRLIFDLHTRRHVGWACRNGANVDHTPAEKDSRTNIRFLYSDLKKKRYIAPSCLPRGGMSGISEITRLIAHVNNINLTR